MNIYIKIFIALIIIFLLFIFIFSKNKFTNLKKLNNKYIGLKYHKLEKIKENYQIIGVFNMPKYDINTPNSFNWTNVKDHIYYKNISGNFIYPIQNQHSPVFCGSCWIINSLDSIATHFNISTKLQNDNKILSQYQFSTQEVLNWFTKNKNKNCYTGGSAYEIGLYSLSYGLNYESNNVYTSKSSKFSSLNTYFGAPPGGCKVWHGNPKILSYNKNNYKNDGLICELNTEKIHITGFIHINKYNEKLIKKLIYLKGSIITAINCDPLLNYKSGIIGYNTILNIPKSETNHVITIIGWDKIDSIFYWICKNSWGNFWGENGFFRIIANKNYLNVEEKMYMMESNIYNNNLLFDQINNPSTTILNNFKNKKSSSSSSSGSGSGLGCGSDDEC